MRAVRLAVPALTAAAMSLSFASVAVAAPTPATGPTTGGGNAPAALVPPKATFSTGCTPNGHPFVTIVETNANPVTVELAGMLMRTDGNAIAPVAADVHTTAPGETFTFGLIAAPGKYLAVAHVVGANSVMDTTQIVTLPVCPGTAQAATQPAKPAPATQPNLANTGGHA